MGYVRLRCSLVWWSSLTERAQISSITVWRSRNWSPVFGLVSRLRKKVS